LTSQQIIMRYPASAYNFRIGPGGPLIYTVPTKAIADQLRAKLRKTRGGPRVRIVVATPGYPAPRRMVQVSRLTVTFSAIGQPQRITAPAHSTPVYGRG
jgi:replicative superfamily II helicase